MEKNKYSYIIPSIIISVIAMFLLYSPQLTDLREKVSTKDNYIDELKSSIEEQKSEISHLEEEKEQLENKIDELENQESTTEPLEEVQVVVQAPQDDIVTSTEPVSNTINEVVKVEPTGENFILNTNTKKFHKPSCGSVSTIKDSNRKDYTGTREEVINMGYSPCKRCNP